MKKIKGAAAVFIVLIFMTGLIAYSESIADAVSDSIKRCIQVIVPSLFAFMALSGFAIRTGIIDQISKPLDMTIGKLLGMPKGTAALFLVSNTAGYPVGCSMLADGVNSGKLSRRTAEIMSVYCYAGGPAFLVNAIGCGIFRAKACGLSVFFSVLTANLLIAAIVNRIYKPEISAAPVCKKVSSDDLLISVTDAGEKVINMCLIIIWFSAMLSVAENTGLPGLIADSVKLSRSDGIMLRSLLEITNAASLDHNAVGELPTLAAVCSFGGLCVILQVKAIIRKCFGMKLFWTWMPVRMVTVYWLNKLYNWIFMDNSIPAFVSNDNIIVELDNFLPSICLIMMIFILVFQKRLDFLKRV